MRLLGTACVFLWASCLSAQSWGSVSGHSSTSLQSYANSTQSQIQSIFAGSSLRTFYAEFKLGSSASTLRSVQRKPVPTVAELQADLRRRYPGLHDDEVDRLAAVMERFMTAQDQVLGLMLDPKAPDDDVVMHGEARQQFLIKLFLAEMDLANGRDANELAGLMEAEYANRCFVQNRK